VRNSFLVKVKAAYGLGFGSIARVIFYRLGVKLGFNPVKKLEAVLEKGVFFLAPSSSSFVNLKPNSQWLDKQSCFGRVSASSSSPPDWHKSCLTGAGVRDPLRPWWEIADFDSDLGDIKGVWEASRFDWVLGFSQQVALGNSAYLNKLNDWLNDWLIHNPAYLGVNWKCGQEASIRVMNLAMASLILGQATGTSGVLLCFVKAHLKRISPTISYAVSQDNNHGTSEAAALYIGGSWLVKNGDMDGNKWFKQGDKWLANRAEHLIEEDGSFSQYSTNYHRVMLDTFSMVEVWRRGLSLEQLGNAVYRKLKSATNWLFYMTQFESGDAPNLGANDGAHLLPLGGSDYRDFRPSVQLASVLFLNRAAYAEAGDWDEPLKWLHLKKPDSVAEKPSGLNMPFGGYAILRNGSAFMMFNYPQFKFRPSQCDALHVDFWLAGENLLRDGGTYSYNAGQSYIDYYGGAESHNTAQFDGREQMPRISRFLLGGWLKASDVEFDVEASRCGASYTDSFCSTHARQVFLMKSLLRVKDTLSNFDSLVILRWRLIPGEWQINGSTVTNGRHTIMINSDVPITRLELVEGKESRYYYQENPIPVLEVEIQQAGSITTEYQY